MWQPTTIDAVNRLQYSRLARYSLRDTPYCAQSLLFAVSATGSAHKRSPSLFAKANRDDKIHSNLHNSEFRIPNSALKIAVKVTLYRLKI